MDQLGTSESYLVTPLLGAFGAAARRRGWRNLSWYSVVMEAPVRVLCKNTSSSRRLTTLKQTHFKKMKKLRRGEQMASPRRRTFPVAVVLRHGVVRRCARRLLAWCGSDCLLQAHSE